MGRYALRAESGTRTSTFSVTGRSPPEYAGHRAGCCPLMLRSLAVSALQAGQGLESDRLAHPRSTMGW